MITDAIAALIAGSSLTETEASQVMSEIMSGEATPAQSSAFLIALRMKGETVEEITGLAETMRQNSLKVNLPVHIHALDTCGTGGDRSGTMNISTAAALIIASAGQPVAKHGNRAATSKCGSADVLEALEVKVEMPPEMVSKSICKHNFGFMYAPLYHPAMKTVGPVRKEIGVRTVFNILGPLTNPANAEYQVLGVPDPSLVRKMAQALLKLGSTKAMVVHGQDGLDEISITAPTVVCEIDGEEGTVYEYVLDPHEFTDHIYSKSDFLGDSVSANAEIILRILSGDKVKYAPISEIVAVNAGAGLYISGVADNLAEGVRLARSIIESGKGLGVLEQLQVISKNMASI